MANVSGNFQVMEMSAVVKEGRNKYLKKSGFCLYAETDDGIGVVLTDPNYVLTKRSAESILKQLTYQGKGYNFSTK